MHQDFSLYEFAIFLSFSHCYSDREKIQISSLRRSFAKSSFFAVLLLAPLDNAGLYLRRVKFCIARRETGKIDRAARKRYFLLWKVERFVKIHHQTRSLYFVHEIFKEILHWSLKSWLWVIYYCPHRSPLYPWIRLLCLFRNPKSKWEMAFKGKLRTLHWTARKVAKLCEFPVCVCMYVTWNNHSYNPGPNCVELFQEFSITVPNRGTNFSWSVQTIWMFHVKNRRWPTRR